MDRGPGGLQSMGSQRVRHDWATELNWTVAQLVKNPPAMQETWVQSLGWEDPNPEWKGYPLQYSGLENSTDCISPWGRRVRHDWVTFTFTLSLSESTTTRNYHLRVPLTNIKGINQKPQTNKPKIKQTKNSGISFWILGELDLANKSTSPVSKFFSPFVWREIYIRTEN